MLLEGKLLIEPGAATGQQVDWAASANAICCREAQRLATQVGVQLVPSRFAMSCGEVGALADYPL